MTLAPRKWATLLFLWLSLATVLTPALDPFGSPLRPTQGSAFNAFTSDVSLGPSRAAAPERDRRLHNPTGGGPDHPDAAPVASPALAGLVLPGVRPAGAAAPAAARAHPARFIADSVQARAPPAP